jgi:hypothetical protein
MTARGSTTAAGLSNLDPVPSRIQFTVAWVAGELIPDSRQRLGHTTD